MSAITSIFARAWGFFQLTEPHLGISYGSIYLGVFVIGMSLRYLIPLLGLGHSGIDTAGNITSKTLRYRDERRRNREMQERRRQQEIDRINRKLKV